MWKSKLLDEVCDILHQNLKFSRGELITSSNNQMTTTSLHFPQLELSTSELRSQVKIKSNTHDSKMKYIMMIIDFDQNMKPLLHQSSELQPEDCKTCSMVPGLSPEI